MSGEDEPRTTTRAALEAAGHLALWPGFYEAAWTGVIAALLGSAATWSATWSAAAGTGLLTTTVFLVDRVKLRPADLDPADARADPARAAFIDRHRRTIRRAIFATGGASAVSLGMVHSPLALIVPLGVLGVWLYGRRPGEPRLKDHRVLKSGAVAVGMTAVALAAVLLSDRGRAPALVAVIGAGLLMALHVGGDAILCDIEDAPSDAEAGTRTWANTLGERRTWILAIALKCLAGVALLVTAVTGASSASALTVAWLLAAPLVGVVPVALVRLAQRRAARPIRLKAAVDGWGAAALLAALVGLTLAG